jgi:hypothetical protein
MNRTYVNIIYSYVLEFPVSVVLVIYLEVELLDHMVNFNVFFFFMVLGIGLRVLHLLGKHSTT